MRKVTQTLAAFAVSAAIFFGYVAAGETAPAQVVQQSGQKATQFQLSNGMKVVVIEDHRSPVVTHMLWFGVGGTDDPPGLSGAAHLFEHLMFKGTKKIAPGDFSKIIARNGGEDNAFTTQDTTAYFQRVAKDRLPLVMEMEADRMRNLQLNETDVTNAGLKSLAQLPKLRRLYVEGTAVDDAGAMQFRAALPKCEVWWGPPSSCSCSVRDA
jgi:zinc protease